MGGNSGNIIVGDKPLADALLQLKHKVAPFRVGRMLQIIHEYKHDESTMNQERASFLVRCAADVVEVGHWE